MGDSQNGRLHVSEFEPRNAVFLKLYSRKRYFYWSVLVGFRDVNISIYKIAYLINATMYAEHFLKYNVCSVLFCPDLFCPVLSRSVLF